MTKLGVGAIACALIAGCGGASARGATTHARGASLSAPESFPSAAAIAALPPPGPVQLDTGVVVGHWEIDAASLAPAAATLDPIYAELAVQRPTAQRSAGLECVARETARVYVAVQGLPGEVLRRFLAARCGAGAIAIAIGVLPITLHDASEAQVLAHVHDTLLEHAVQVTDPAANRVGLAVFRDGNTMTIGVASALVQLDLEPIVPVASGGHLRFQARIARAPSELIVMATSGERSVATCAVNGTQPTLEIDCPFQDGDARAYVEILGRDGDAVLCMPLALLIGIASEGAGLTYDRRVPSVAVALDATQLGAAVLPLLNGERAQVGAPALSLSTTQSTANGSVVPYAFGSDAHAVEQAMLYVMAGWELAAGPLVREGRTIQIDAGRSTDAGQWLFQALETPLERWVLLDPEARVLAIGAASSDGATFGIASTYRFFDRDPASDRAAAEHALDEARRASGRPPAGFVQLEPLEDATAAIAERDADPAAALDEALARIVRSYASARGHVYVASVLEHAPWDADLLEAPHVGIAVRHAQPSGSAWGVYVVTAVALP